MQPPPLKSRMFAATVGTLSALAIAGVATVYTLGYDTTYGPGAVAPETLGGSDLSRNPASPVPEIGEEPADEGRAGADDSDTEIPVPESEPDEEVAVDDAPDEGITPNTADRGTDARAERDSAPRNAPATDADSADGSSSGSSDASSSGSDAAAASTLQPAPIPTRAGPTPKPPAPPAGAQASGRDPEEPPAAGASSTAKDPERAPSAGAGSGAKDPEAPPQHGAGAQ